MLNVLMLDKSMLRNVEKYAGYAEACKYLRVSYPSYFFFPCLFRTVTESFFIYICIYNIKIYNKGCILLSTFMYVKQTVKGIHVTPKFPQYWLDIAIKSFCMKCTICFHPRRPSGTHLDVSDELQYLAAHRSRQLIIPVLVIVLKVQQKYVTTRTFHSTECLVTRGVTGPGTVCKVFPVLIHQTTESRETRQDILSS